MCGVVCKFSKSCTSVIWTLELALKVSDMTFRRDCKKSEHSVTFVMARLGITYLHVSS